MHLTLPDLHLRLPSLAPVGITRFADMRHIAHALLPRLFALCRT